MSHLSNIQVDDLSNKVSKKMSINKNSDFDKTVNSTKRTSLTTNEKIIESSHSNNELNGKIKSKKYANLSKLK